MTGIFSKMWHRHPKKYLSKIQCSTVPRNIIARVHCLICFTNLGFIISRRHLLLSRVESSIFSRLVAFFFFHGLEFSVIFMGINYVSRVVLRRNLTFFFVASFTWNCCKMVVFFYLFLAQKWSCLWFHDFKWLKLWNHSQFHFWAKKR